MMNRSRAALIVLLTILALSLPAIATTKLRLPAIVGDHMVLQRNAKARIWGWAEPGQVVHVSATWLAAPVGARADKNGCWQAELMTADASAEPAQITMVAGDETITLHDILIGEVWFCSGQSNMEWGLNHVLNAEQEIAAADFPQIRLCHVTRTWSPTPREDVEASWKRCTPESAASFSAVAYFFGRKLHQDLNIPIGLINSSWGGSMAEQWISIERFVELDELGIVQSYKQMLNDPTFVQDYERALAAWEAENLLPDPGNSGFAAGWAAAEPPDGQAWQTMEMPRMWEEVEGMAIDGVVWFRREIRVPEAWTGKNLRLELGPIDDFDTTYFNNELVGATDQSVSLAWQQPRRYELPGRVVRPGKRNVIAIRVFDHWKDGGMRGPAEAMKLYVPGDEENAIPLAGPWQYRVEAATPPKERSSPPPPAPLAAASEGSPAALFNAMVHPILPYTIRGTIWYQGESNGNRAQGYRQLLPALIRDWRDRWGVGDFPFLIVQLANYSHVLAEPADSPWAELREAQILTASNMTGVYTVPTIDIGDADDIHPRNKQETGRRLALAAEANVYDADLIWSGPMYKSSTIENGKVRITFNHVGGGLSSRDDQPLSGFAIAGDDRKFVWAEARIEGNDVVVWSDRVPDPKAVRYAWANNPVCNLRNRTGLPASPFRTDDWPGITQR